MSFFLTWSRLSGLDVLSFCEFPFKFLFSGWKVFIEHGGGRRIEKDAVMDRQKERRSREQCAQRGRKQPAQRRGGGREMGDCSVMIETDTEFCCHKLRRL